MEIVKELEEKSEMRKFEIKHEITLRIVELELRACDSTSTDIIDAIKNQNISHIKITVSLTCLRSFFIRVVIN